MVQPSTKRVISRRMFMQQMTLGVGVGCWLGGCGQEPRLWRVLTDKEVLMLEVLTEQIIPADEDPGAREAGCVNFIDRQLAGFYREHLPTYRKGLLGLDQTSQNLYRKDFLKLEWDQQTEVMRLLEESKAVGTIWQDVSSRDFFRLIRDHTMQGFYGSPRHGGNRDYISYRMLGLDYPQIVGRNRYRSA